MLMNKPGSERVGYGLNVARMPRRMKAAYRGSCLRSHKHKYIFLSNKEVLTEI